MSRRVQVFKEQAIALDASNIAVSDARLSTEKERQRLADVEAEVARQQGKIVSETAAGLSALAAGNLTHRITAEFPGDYALLKTDFNAAMGALKETMSVVLNNVTVIRSGSGEIAQASDGAVSLTLKGLRQLGVSRCQG